MAERRAIPEALLDLPVRYTTRVVALDRLDEVLTEFDRLHAARDPETLHDFRVAVRRLRVFVRVYHEELEGSLGGKSEKQLAALSDLTGPARDHDVQLAWLDQHLADPSPAGAVGLRWLRNRLQEERLAADAKLRDKLPGRVNKLEKRLRKRLGVYRAPVDREHFTQGDNWATVTARLLRDHAAVLRERLVEIETPCGEALHRARIAGKRLRYLLEPMVPHAPGARELVDQLRDLQRLLGDITDGCLLVATITRLAGEATAEQGQRIAGVLQDLDHVGPDRLQREREQDPSPGLFELAEILRGWIAGRFQSWEETWPRKRQEELLGLVAAVVQTLSDRRQLPVEIERKYLLRCLPQRAGSVTPLEIAQGYLPGERITERIRGVVAGRDAHWYRTVKLGTGVSRVEIEEEISGSFFESLWPLTAGRRVRKRRYVVPDGDLTWEIDEFVDRDLMLAEVELSDPATRPELPEWLIPCVEREVTGEAEFVNVNLAR